MPIAQWTATEFAQYYKCKDRNPESPTYGQLLGYGRQWAREAQHEDRVGLPYFRRRWRHLLDNFSIDTNHRVLVVGAAFGFLIEEAHRAGYNNVWGLDSSPHCEADPNGEKAPTVDIIWRSIRAPQATLESDFQTVTGATRFRWIIVEDVDTSKTDTVVGEIAAACELYLQPTVDSDHVIHMVTPISQGGSANPTYPDMNWKTLENWKLLVPTHSWMTVGGRVAT